MRVILFTGKGGVGKTTTAAATAVHAARAGIKTLVMSTDAAHSLGDALGVDLAPPRGGEQPVREVETGLCALQVSASSSARTSWQEVRGYVHGLLGSLGIDPVVGQELTSLPGADEVVALLELRAQVESGPWDLVVVDCAPTAETLRLLALPEALAWHLERLMPAQRGLLRSLRPAAAAATGLPLPGVAVLDALRRWHASLREVQHLLRADSTSVRLVLTPERVVLAEARRTLTSLGLHGFTVDQVVVNRVFPDAATGAVPTGGDAAAAPDPWRSAWNRAQQQGLVEVQQSFASLPVVHAPYLDHEPIGADDLDELHRACTGDLDTDPLTPRGGEGMTVTRTGRRFVLRLPLPLVSAADVDLGRRGDELVVTVGEHRRLLSLPAALRRCVVTGASVRDGRLRVTFIPDERVWPRDG
jgi:arsenite/tail-anchored protein-transporting ATPase